ncbi:MAG: RluA family pseudouridine synthase [Candidatus Ratteibacteria bacterium]|nr:RluA family pseudouridine synthase [Candidatus Ratteibacteria bacterium]
MISKEKQVREFKFSPSLEEENQRLDKFLLSKLGFSRSKAQKLIHNGNVKVNQKIIDIPHHRVKHSEIIEVQISPPSPTTVEAEDIPLNVLYEDKELIVINKPAGLVVHPAGEKKTQTLVNALLNHCGEEILKIGGNERGGLVHRLDKDTSGVMVIAKTENAHNEIAHQFQERKTEKTYIALAWGTIKEDTGEINAPIGRSIGDRRKMSVFSAKVRESTTFFRVLEIFQDFTLLELKPKTGRTHQIRVHLSSIGHPIIGDEVYGGKKRIASSSLKGIKDKIERQFLHAQKLRFYHPKLKKIMEFSAPLPEDMQYVIDWARKNKSMQNVKIKY